MYCKYCGSQIAENSVFCSKCGKLIVEQAKSPSTGTSSIERQWVSTQNLQWRKPVWGRLVQLLLLFMAFFFAIYSLASMIWIGDNLDCVLGYWGDYWMAKDPWGILKFTSVEPEYSQSACENKFITKMFFFVHGPSLLVIGLVIAWIIGTRFPNGNDLLPRDIADEIEKYKWYGFSRSKYVFFKKDRKYGIIDVKNYCINVPAQYDSIQWRIPNKTYDACLKDEKLTVSITKSNVKNPNIITIKNIIKKTLAILILVLLVLSTLFTIVVPFICFFTHDDVTPIATKVGLLIAFPIFFYITYRAFRNYNGNKQ